MTDRYSGKTITLETILKDRPFFDDQLLPTQLNGHEGISTPFTYDLTMVRRPNRGLIDARDMIGTPAKFGLKIETHNDPVYAYRTGVFQTFNLMSAEGRGLTGNGTVVYSGRLVPAFMIFGLRTRYRIFENLTVVDVIKQVLDEMRVGHENTLNFDISRLWNIREQFVPVEYCVQYGESDFGFLCRLMARYGIWYIFDRGSSPNQAGQLLDAINNTLVLGVGPIHAPTPCDWSGMYIQENKRGGQITPTPQSPDTGSSQFNILNFRHMNEPPPAKVSGGDFNMLEPDNVTRISKNVREEYALMKDPSDFASREEFPVRSDTDPKPSKIPRKGTLDDAVECGIHSEEARTFAIAGSSGNPSLLPGRMMEVVTDYNEVEKTSVKYLINTAVLVATENSYYTSIGGDVAYAVDTLLGNFWGTFASPGVGQALSNIVFSSAASGMNNYLQNEQAEAWGNALYPNLFKKDVTQMLSRQTMPMILGGITQGAIGAAIGFLGKSVSDVITQQFLNNAGTFSNSFQAIPLVAGRFLAPAAKGEAPRASGPHIAIVIDDNGNTKKGRIYADPIGRVRVRFAWDIAAEKWAPYHSDPLKIGPLTSDADACWVRVAEAWAGASFGAQFLPRVGDEVLVQFLDGDPERPIIAGRLYNLKSTLPFPGPHSKPGNITAAAHLQPMGARNLTRTGIKTRTMNGSDGQESGFHLLRFDDLVGAEQLLIRSQGRLDETALRSRYETTYGARHERVVAGKDAHGNTIGGDAFTTVGGEADLTISGDMLAAVKGKLNASIVKDAALEFDAGFNAQVKKDLTLNADNIIIEAKTQLSLKVGGNYVVITAGAVYLNGTAVNVNSGGSPGTATTFDMTDPAAAEQADPGDPPNWLTVQNANRQAVTGKSANRTRPVDPLTAPNVTNAAPGGDLVIKVPWKRPAPGQAPQPGSSGPGKDGGQ